MAFMTRTAMRVPRAGAVLLLSLVAVLAVRESVSFLGPSGARAPAPSSPATSVRPWATPSAAEPEGPAAGAAHGPTAPFMGLLSFLAAVVLAFGSTSQPASAGLLGDFGAVDYEAETQKTDKSASFRKKQQVAVLEDAMKNASDKVAKRQAELAQKARATELLKKLDAQKRKEEAEKEEREKVLQEKRAKIMAELAKKSAASGDAGKASEVFSKFSTETKERQDAEAVAAKKQEVLRSQVLGDLEKRKSEAQAAADEADAIALRIEALAKTAREAAVAAKKSAASLSAQ